MLYPLKFHPLLVDRIWGGSTLTRYGKAIPSVRLVGETWEISDRDDAQSIVANGPLAGKPVRQLLSQELLGHNCRGATRFPLLIKLIDARERLSLQVHPPASLGRGEPKTEMWYILEADPGAELIAGLKRGVTRAEFESNIQDSYSKLETLFHRIPVRTGDSLFVPSGRLHAIGGGLVIAEIQQNSDTTYRVYDWGRVDTDGKPRQLHLAESLASIDFHDFEPKLTPFPITCDFFHVEKLDIKGKLDGHCDGTSFQVLVGLAGNLRVQAETMTPGECLLLPAALGRYSITGNGQVLRAVVPPPR